MATSRTPVWLVTGYLGAGKTTLLARWLGEPAWAHAALVVNEVGEVGLDDRLLARAVDSAALVANACICCTGLPGLEQALSDLWWDRLHRRRPAFDAVVIETTGLADPGPVIQAFQTDEFLQARYVLAGVVVVVSATTGWSELTAHPEALAQVRHADLLVLTKVDRADPSPWIPRFQAERPQAAVALSAQASLAWETVQGLIEKSRPASSLGVPSSKLQMHLGGSYGQLDQGGRSEHHEPHESQERHGHHHDRQAHFLPCPSGLDRDALAHWADAQRTAATQRLKGVLQAADGRLFMAQWALGDEAVALVGFEGPVPRLGLTCIA